MKKYLAILLASIITMFTIGCTGTNEEKVTVKVNEVTHSIFYAPFYIAIEGGFFEKEGITIELTNGGGSDASMTALLSGGCEIALLGPETGIYTYLGNPNDMPLIIGQLTKRDGSFLMAREPDENFTWSKLREKEVIAGRRGGSPAMSLEYALNKNNLFNGENVMLNFDVQFNLTAAAFIGGTGDYVTMFEPVASEYQREGKAFIVASVGEESGEIPFTCFMAKESYLKSNLSTVTKFAKAMYNAIDFIEKNTVEDVAKVLINSFPATSLESVKDSLVSYKKIDAWQKDLIMSESAFTKLQDVMENAGELNERVPFDKLVDTSIFEMVYEDII